MTCSTISCDERHKIAGKSDRPVAYSVTSTQKRLLTFHRKNVLLDI